MTSQEINAAYETELRQIRRLVYACQEATGRPRSEADERVRQFAAVLGRLRDRLIMEAEARDGSFVETILDADDETP